MQESSEVRDALVTFIQALSKGDTASIERLLSKQRGLLVVGTDPREWWSSGHADVVRVFKAQLSEMGAFTFKATDPRGYAEGSVGWAADRFNVKVGDNEIPLRLSAVFHQEDGDWKVVQWHASVGVANEEEVGKELTTS
jgi:hypothetical protein